MPMAGLLLDSEYETDNADMDAGYAGGAAYKGTLPAPSSTYSGGLGYGGSSAVTGSDQYGGGAGYEDAALPSFTAATPAPTVAGSTPTVVGSTPALVNPTTFSPPKAIDATRGESTTPDAYSYFPTYAPEANFPDANTFLTRGSTDKWNEAVDRYNAEGVAALDKLIVDANYAELEARHESAYVMSVNKNYMQYGTAENTDEYGNKFLRDNYFTPSWETEYGGGTYIDTHPEFYLDSAISLENGKYTWSKDGTQRVLNPDNYKDNPNDYYEAIANWYNLDGSLTAFIEPFAFDKKLNTGGYNKYKDSWYQPETYDSGGGVPVFRPQDHPNYAGIVAGYEGSPYADTFADLEKATTGQGYETVTDDSQLGQQYYEYEFSEDGGNTWSSAPPAGYNSDGTSISDVGIRAQSSTGERLVPEVIPYTGLDELGKGNYGTLDVKRLTPEEVEAEGYVHKPPKAIDARRGLQVKSPLGEAIALPDDYSQFADPAFALQASIVLDKIYSTTDGSVSSTVELGEATREEFKTEDYNWETDNLFNEKWVNYVGKTLSLMGGGAGAGAVINVVVGLAETANDYVNGDISFAESLMLNGMPAKAVDFVIALFPPVAIANAVIDAVTGKTIGETLSSLVSGDYKSLQDYTDQIDNHWTGISEAVQDFFDDTDITATGSLQELVLDEHVGDSFLSAQSLGFYGLDEEGARPQSYISSTKIDVGEGWEQVTDLDQTGIANYEYEFTTDGGKTWTKVPPAGVNADGTQQDFNERVAAHQALEVEGGIAGSAGFDIGDFNFSSDFIEQSFSDFSAFADATNGAFGAIDLGIISDGLGGNSGIVEIPPTVYYSSYGLEDEF